MHHSLCLVLDDLDALPNRDDTAVENLKKDGRICNYKVGFLKKLSLPIGYQRIRNGQDQLLL
jgi:hypothetical protein